MSTLIPLAPFVLTAFLALLTVLLIVGVLLLMVLRIVFGGRKRNPQLDAEEARLMQDLHHSFQKLEERVESLETILLETGAIRREPTAAGPQRQTE
ncbi:MAG TPA: hypothetical protein VMZ06_02950 [Candidatus Bathyarchaeia archaeon]|nr:hypothetical protein [Candidatus Bathyarchaeia archaeon]